MLFISICRGIKLPAVQSQVEKRGGGRGGRASRGRGGQQTAQRCKSSVKEEKEDPLGSEPEAETESTEHEEEIKKVSVIRNEPTARRGKHFKMSQGQGRSTKTKLPVMKDCSVELSEVEDENGKRKIKDKNESDIEVIEKPEETLKEKQEKLKRKTSGKKIDAKIPVEKVEEKKKKGGKEQEAKKSDAVKGKKSDAVEVPASNIETEVVSDGMHLEMVVAYVKDVSDPDIPPPSPRELTKEEIEMARLEKEIGAMLETRTKIKDSEKRISVLKNILKVLGAEAAKDQAREVEEMKNKEKEKKLDKGNKKSESKDIEINKDSEKLTQEGGGKKEERYVSPEKEQSRDEEEIKNKEKERKPDEAKEDMGNKNKGELEKSGVVPNISEEVTPEGGEIKERNVNSDDVNSDKKKVTEEEEKPQEETPQEEMVVPTEEEKQKEVPTEEEKEKQKEMPTEEEKEKEKEVPTEEEKEKTSEVDSSDVKSQKKVPEDEQNPQEKTPKEEQTKEEVQKVQEVDKSDVKSNGKTETNDSEIRDKKLGEKKKVSFNAEFDITEEEIQQDGVNVMVENVIQKLSDAEKGNGPGKIDERYVNYPSSQEKE